MNVIVGNLTRDPELRFTANGLAVANFAIASTPRIKGKNELGETTWQDGDTTFHDVVAWRQQAENVADALRKGDRVVVTGRENERSWETREGEKRTSTEFVADEVSLSLKFKAVHDLVQGR